MTGTRTPRIWTPVLSGDGRPVEAGVRGVALTVTPTMSTATYAVTYVFDTATDAASDETPTRLDAVTRELRRDGVPIEFRGGTQRLDADGRVVEMTARFDARTKGAVGRLNCRGGLPASGPPARVRVDR